MKQNEGITIRINPGTHRKLKIIAAINGIKINDAAERAVLDWVQKNDPNK